MEHKFDVLIAEKVSLDASILLNNIIFWVAHNKANNTNYHDGRYWTYNSVSAFLELFPYLTKHKIINALKLLEEEGLIVTGNYNKSSYDRTKWYSVNHSHHLLKIRNGDAKNQAPIPDNKPNSKPNNNNNDDFSNFENDESEDKPEDKPTSDYGKLLDKYMNYGKELIKDEIWVESFSMRNKILAHHRHAPFQFVLLEFVNDISMRGTEHTNIKEFKAHFVNWVKMKTYKELSAMWDKHRVDKKVNKYDDTWLRQHLGG